MEEAHADFILKERSHFYLPAHTKALGVVWVQKAAVALWKQAGDSSTLTLGAVWEGEGMLPGDSCWLSREEKTLTRRRVHSSELSELCSSLLRGEHHHHQPKPPAEPARENAGESLVDRGFFPCPLAENIRKRWARLP